MALRLLPPLPTSNSSRSSLILVRGPSASLKSLPQRKAPCSRKGLSFLQEIRFEDLGYGEPSPDYSSILANVVVVNEQQVGYKTGNKPGSRLQNSLESLRHQEKNNPSPHPVSGAESKGFSRDNLLD